MFRFRALGSRFIQILLEKNAFSKWGDLWYSNIHSRKFTALRCVFVLKGICECRANKCSIHIHRPFNGSWLPICNLLDWTIRMRLNRWFYIEREQKPHKTNTVNMHLNQDKSHIAIWNLNMLLNIICHLLLTQESLLFVSYVICYE